MRVAARAVLFAAALAPLLLAQEPSRDKAFGLVRDVDGKPWAGATVELLHRAHPGVLDAAMVDSLTATADDKGRFRVELLAGMPYTVWAHSEPDGGVYRSSQVLEGMVPGVPLVLEEQVGVRRQRRFVLAPDPSWTRPLRVVARCRLGRMTAVQELQPDAEGVYTTPAWPANLIIGGVLERDVEVLAIYLYTTEDYVRSYGLFRNGPKVAEDADVVAAMAATTSVPIGPRRELLVRLSDGERPIAGAEVRAESPPPRNVLGTSDPDGVLHIVTAAAEFEGVPYQSVVLVDGFAEGELDRELFEKQTGDGPAQLTMTSGYTASGRLLIGDDEPLANAPLVLQGSIGLGQGSTWFGVEPRLFRSAADGRFRIPGRADGYGFRVSLVLSPAQRARLAHGDDPAPIWPLALIAPEQPGRVTELGDLRVDRLRGLDITVHPPAGTPPGSARVVVAPLLDGVSRRPAEPDVLHTDRRGRVRLLTSPCGRLLVHATTKKGVAWAVIDDSRAAVELRLDAQHAVRFRILDEAGKPVAGASVGLVSVQDGGTQDPVEQSVRSTVQDWCSVHAVPFKDSRTDDNGEVELLVPLLDVDLDLYVTQRDASIDKRIVLPLPRDRDPETIVLTVERPR